jgi:Polyketide cyclase / dehydrase and lipid transport
MITTILLLLAVVIIVAFLVFIARQPDEFLVTRSVAISTNPDVPFAQVNDLHKWVSWSPWEGIDPGLKRTYGGPESGVGATYAWDGNNKVSAGRMTITESQPANLVRLDLNFLRPFAANHLAEFAFSPRGGHTVVTWSLSGRETFFTKAFSLVCGRDRIVGGMFDQGLAKMKTVCESFS